MKVAVRRAGIAMFASILLVGASSADAPLSTDIPRHYAITDDTKLQQEVFRYADFRELTSRMSTKPVVSPKDILRHFEVVRLKDGEYNLKPKFTWLSFDEREVDFTVVLKEVARRAELVGPSNSFPKYVGVGIVLKVDKNSGALLIREVIPGSPAEKAGLKKDDEMVKVDGVPVDSKDINDTIQRLRGNEEIGTHVLISIRRPGSQDEQAYQVERTIFRQRLVVTKRNPQTGRAEEFHFEAYLPSAFEKKLAQGEEKDHEFFSYMFWLGSYYYVDAVDSAGKPFKLRQLKVRASFWQHKLYFKEFSGGQYPDLTKMFLYSMWTGMPIRIRAVVEGIGSSFSEDGVNFEKVEIELLILEAWLED